MATILGFTVIPAYGDPLLGTYLVPGTSIKLTLRKEVAPLLLAVARDFDREVEALKAGQCGGFNPRKIAGSTSWSRHALGCAIDLNWQLHPMGKANTFTAVKQAAIRRILARYTYQGKQIIRWGGTYSAGNRDDMHLEVNAERAVILAAVKALQTPAKPTDGTSKPGSRVLKLAAPAMHGPDVAFLRRWVGAPAGDVFDAAAKARVVRYQKIVGLIPDGIAGQATWSKVLGHTIKL